MTRKIAISVVLGLALIAAFGCFKKSSGPSDVVNQFAAAMKAGEYEKAVGFMSEKSINKASEAFDMIFSIAESDPDMKAEFEKELGVSLDEFKAMNPSQRLAKILSMSPDENPFKDIEYTVLSETIDGEKATVKVKTGDEEDEITLIKENGAWKIDMEM
ncbi:DUF4878 domain-containing protein [candidate division WOR-3 bacterium]|nr:DUF4878 domain-containing protein [candidate division WOR-3 bacterium]